MTHYMMLRWNPIYTGAVRPELPMFHHTWAWVA